MTVGVYSKNLLAIFEFTILKSNEKTTGNQETAQGTVANLTPCQNTEGSAIRVAHSLEGGSDMPFRLTMNMHTWMASFVISLLVC